MPTRPEPVKRIKMTNYEVLTEKTTYPKQVYDQKSGRTIEVKETVETMKRYNKNVTYTLPASVADKLLAKKTAVLV